MDLTHKIILLDRIRMSGLSSIKTHVYVDSVMDGAIYRILKPPILRKNNNFWIRLKQKSMTFQYNGETIPQTALISNHYEDIELR